MHLGSALRRLSDDLNSRTNVSVYRRPTARAPRIFRLPTNGDEVEHNLRPVNTLTASPSAPLPTVTNRYGLTGDLPPPASRRCIGSRLNARNSLRDRR